jgi:hypothetical protein
MIVEEFRKILFVLPGTVVTVLDHVPEGTDSPRKLGIVILRILGMH